MMEPESWVADRINWGLTRMSFKQVIFYIVCAATWLLLLPVCLFGGATALLSYAVVSELGELFAGGTGSVVDSSTAREIARRVCLGN
jgi:uncharacterized membrane protein YjjB (DUF3815 family)